MLWLKVNLMIMVSTLLDLWFTMVQGPVVQRTDDVIQWIDHYPVDNCEQNVMHYPLDSNLSSE